MGEGGGGGEISGEVEEWVRRWRSVGGAMGEEVEEWAGEWVRRWRSGWEDR